MIEHNNNNTASINIESVENGYIVTYNKNRNKKVISSFSEVVRFLADKFDITDKDRESLWVKSNLNNSIE